MSSNQFPQNLDFKEIIERVAIRSQKCFLKIKIHYLIQSFSWISRHELQNFNETENKLSIISNLKKKINLKVGKEVKD